MLLTKMFRSLKMPMPWLFLAVMNLVNRGIVTRRPQQPQPQYSALPLDKAIRKLKEHPKPFLMFGEFRINDSQR